MDWVKVLACRPASLSYVHEVVINTISHSCSKINMLQLYLWRLIQG